MKMNVLALAGLAGLAVAYSPVGVLAEGIGDSSDDPLAKARFMVEDESQNLLLSDPSLLYVGRVDVNGDNLFDENDLAY